MTHYCIGNPCWICYPDLAPKGDAWNPLLLARQIPETEISGLLQDLLLRIFDQGLDEDTYFSHMIDGLTIEEIVKERVKLLDSSIEAILIDRLITDYNEKI